MTYVTNAEVHCVTGIQDVSKRGAGMALNDAKNAWQFAGIFVFVFLSFIF